MTNSYTESSATKGRNRPDIIRTNGPLEEKLEKIKDKKSKKDENRLWSMVSLATNLGFSISIPIVGGALLGNYLDNKLNSSPKVTLSLIFLGLLSSILNIYTIIKRIKEE